MSKKRSFSSLALCVAIALAACAPANAPTPAPPADVLTSPLASPAPVEDPLAGLDLVYYALRGGSRQVLRRPPGQAARPLTIGGLNNTEPRWSPDGRQIVYTANPAEGRYELYLMDADGGNPRRLLKRDFAYNWGASWSPDGRQIAFASNESGYSQIYVVGLDGEDPRQLTTEGNNFLPDWSPDGRRIAFTSDRGGEGDNEIYVMNADGSGVQQLTNNAIDDAAPSWSPDGRRLAYHSYEQGVFNIHIYDLEQRQARPLTREALPVRFPAWTPDGRHVLATQELVERTTYEALVIDARSGQAVARLPTAEGLRAR